MLAARAVLLAFLLLRLCWQMLAQRQSLQILLRRWCSHVYIRLAEPVLCLCLPLSSIAACPPPPRPYAGGGVRSGPGAARTILLFHIISARRSKQPLMVCTFLKVNVELGSYFLFLQEQIKDIIIPTHYVATLAALAAQLAD
jgi:hypothetical protein